MKILIIDNYDSFTYNLYQYVGEILKVAGKPFVLDVIRNDKITIQEIRKRYDQIIISPGPGDPSDKKYFGVSADVLLEVGKRTPVLGVCLGMQGMAHYFGGRVKRADRLMHGKTSLIRHDGKGIFRGLPQGLEVMRYHSLVADPETLPDCLKMTAIVSKLNGNTRHSGDPPAGGGSRIGTIASDPGQARMTEKIEIMGLRHKIHPIEGIQFHPESFATEGGKMMLRNFLFRGL